MIMQHLLRGFFYKNLTYALDFFFFSLELILTQDSELAKIWELTILCNHHDIQETRHIKKECCRLLQSLSCLTKCW